MKVAVGSALLLAVVVAVLAVVLNVGQGLPAPAPVLVSTPLPAPPVDYLPRVLLALTAVIATGQLLAKAMGRIGQPAVIGEVVAGIVLGPSLLGPHLSSLLLPIPVAPYLGVVAQLGILLYLFTVGLELDLGVIRERASTLAATALASTALPFVLGAVLALFLFTRFAGERATFPGFALFLGLSLSVTAFPVLARILSDRGMDRSDIGTLALGAAAIGDVLAWCLLALVVGVSKAKVNVGLVVIAETVAYVVAMVFVAGPLLRRLMARWETGPLTSIRIALVMATLLLSAWITESIGIHALFGAFLLGAILPHEGVVARTLAPQLRPLVGALLLPAFFALTGMRTRINLMSGVDIWLICGGIIVVATAGKFFGAYAAARGTGIGGRDAAVLGVLMNARGLMELIVLSIGRDLRIISPVLFAMLVVMALVTTIVTSPLLQALLPRSRSV